MQFYFQYVEGLRALDEETDDIDPSLFGNIFHDAAQIFYTDLMLHHNGDRAIQKEWIQPFLQKGNPVEVPVNFIRSMHLRREELYE
jgi:hypothetical protein